MLTSAANPRLKRLRSLLEDARERRRERRWVAEGLRLAEEAARSGLPLEAAYVSPEFTGEREEALIDGLTRRGVEVVAVGRGLLRELSDTRTPQGIAVVLEAPEWSWDDLAARPGPVLILDRLQDPGNVGALARSLDAAGGAGLVLTSATADAGNPKTLRASAGALFRLPCLRAEEGEAARRLALPVVVTSGRGGLPPEELPLHRPFALVLGQEGEGVCAFWDERADHRATIPMREGVESLNVAAAGAVLLFEAARQRRTFPASSPAC